MRDHPFIKKVSQEQFLGYDEAEGIVRYRAGTGDVAAAAAVREVDAERARAKKEALALNTDMAKRLGLDLDGAAKLVSALASDAKLLTWLNRRVSLTVAHERLPDHDQHPENA